MIIESFGNGLNFMCNTSITEEDMLLHMAERVLVINGNWLIPKFVKFQYGSLDSNRPVIISVIKELEKHNHFVMIAESLGHDTETIKRKRKDIVLSNQSSVRNTGGQDKKNGKNQMRDFETQKSSDLAERIKAQEAVTKGAADNGGKD
jgi:hypothetical protein